MGHLIKGIQVRMDIMGYPMVEVSIGSAIIRFPLPVGSHQFSPIMIRDFISEKIASMVLADIKDTLHLDNMILSPHSWSNDFHLHFGSPAAGKTKAVPAFPGGKNTGKNVSYEPELKKAIPALNEVVKCPECEKSDTLSVIIIHINDGHKRSREFIADWLETLSLDLTFKERENAEDNV